MEEELKAHTEIGELEHDWDDLADRVGASPFLRPGWISAWWEAFGSGELLVIALRREGRLSGVIPLFRRRGTLASTTNYHTPVYGPVFEDRQAAAALAKGLFDQRPRQLRLSFLGEDVGWLEAVRAAAAEAGYRVAERTMFRSPYITLEDDFQRYWRSRSRNLRRSVRRARNRLDDRGEVSVQVVEDEQGLEQHLEEAFRIEASGWKSDQGTAIISRPETLCFYEDVARWAAAREMLRLVVLRVAGKGVVMHLAIESGGSYMTLKAGYDSALKKVGPAKVLDREMLERAYSLGLTSFDFLGRTEPYKLDWADEFNDRLEISAFSRSPAGRLDELLQTRGRAAARRVLARCGSDERLAPANTRARSAPGSRSASMKATMT